MCSRPAVSTSTRSAPRLDAAAIASNTTEPGSAPSWPRTSSPPVRSAHSRELVGGRGAERVGRREHDAPAFADCSRCASLPIVVVFPTPFTPTNIHTFGSPSPWCSARSASASRATTSSRRSAMSPSGSPVFSALARARTASSSSWWSACRRRRGASPLRARPRCRRRSCAPAIPPNTPENAARVWPSRSRSRGLTRSTGSTTSGSGSGASTSGSVIVGGAAGVSPARASPDGPVPGACAPRAVPCRSGSSGAAGRPPPTGRPRAQR